MKYLKKYIGQIITFIIGFVLGTGVGQKMFITYIHFRIIFLAIVTIGIIILVGYGLFKLRKVQTKVMGKIQPKWKK